MALAICKTDVLFLWISTLSFSYVTTFFLSTCIWQCMSPTSEHRNLISSRVVFSLLQLSCAQNLGNTPPPPDCPACLMATVVWVSYVVRVDRGFKDGLIPPLHFGNSGPKWSDLPKNIEFVGRPDRNLCLLTPPSPGLIPRKQAVTSAPEGPVEMISWRAMSCMGVSEYPPLPLLGTWVTLILWTLRGNGLGSSLPSD